MSSLTKKDQGVLYGRAQQLGHQSWQMDEWADQLAQEGMDLRATAHRAIAKALRDEAEECRRWADGVTG